MTQSACPAAVTALGYCTPDDWRQHEVRFPFVMCRMIMTRVSTAAGAVRGKITVFGWSANG